MVNPFSGFTLLVLTLRGLAKMNYKWSNFQRPFSDAVMMNVVRLEAQMKPVDVATLLWSIGELELQLDSVPEYFSKTVWSLSLTNIGKMNAQDMARTIWGFSGTGLSWDQLPEPIRWLVFRDYVSFNISIFS